MEDNLLTENVLNLIPREDVLPEKHPRYACITYLYTVKFWIPVFRGALIKLEFEELGIFGSYDVAIYFLVPLFILYF